MFNLVKPDEQDLYDPSVTDMPMEGLQNQLPAAALQNSGDDALAQLLQSQKNAQEKKSMLGVAGGILQSFANRPSGYELYTGNKSARPDIKGIMDSAASGVSNPMADKEKAYAFLKAKRENETGNRQESFRNSLKNNPDGSESNASKAYKQTIIASGGDPIAVGANASLDLYDQGFSPAKMAEIKAKSNVEFNNEKELKKIGLENDLKKFNIEYGFKSKEKKDEKSQENDNKDAHKLDEALSKGWAGRSGEAGKVQGKINAAERAQALLDQAKLQPGGLDTRQTEELSLATAALLGGGSNASARVEALIPHSAYGNWNKAKEWMTNSPQGMGQGDFTKRLEETISREKALAQKQMRAYQMSELPAHARFRNSNPALYNEILNAKGLGPGSDSVESKAPELKVVGDKKYKKVNGGWEEVE